MKDREAVIIETKNGQIASIKLPESGNVGVYIYETEQEPLDNIRYFHVCHKIGRRGILDAEYEIERENAEVDILDSGKTIGELNKTCRFVQKTGIPVYIRTSTASDEICYLCIANFKKY